MYLQYANWKVNSADPDHIGPLEPAWSGVALYP